MNLKEKVLIRKDLECNNYDSLLTTINSILKHEKNGYNYYIQARALFNLERYNDSLTAIKEALQYSDASDELLLLAGQIYFQLNYFNKAEEFFVHAIRKKNDYAEAYASYAFLLFVTGFEEKCKAMIHKAFDIEQENIFALVTWFKILLYVNNMKKESYTLQKIITHTSGRLYENLNIALIYASRGERQKFKHYVSLAEKVNNREQALFKALKSLLKVGQLSISYNTITPKNRGIPKFTIALPAVIAVYFLYRMNQIGIALVICTITAMFGIGSLVTTLVSFQKKG